jgi:hypothetical protein
MYLKLHIASFVLFIALAVQATAESVDIASMDAVFLNYDRSGSGLWELSEFSGYEDENASHTVRASKAGVVEQEAPTMAFDGSARTKYCTSEAAYWLDYRSKGKQEPILAYALTSANDAPDRDPRDWTLKGSNDGTSWTVLDTRAGEPFAKRFQRRVFELPKPVQYTWYRLEVTRNHGNSISQLAELEFLNELVPQGNTATAAGDWRPLFAADLSDAEFAAGVWTVRDGVLTASEDKVIWTVGDYENFVLDLEFKNGPGSNSGVLLYVTDPKRWVPNSVEIQIADDHAKRFKNANRTFLCGAAFGRLAASQSVVKPAGEWNHYTITCKGPLIDVVLNGVHVTSLDMRKWNSATLNPDGSEKPRWLNKPLSEHPTKGRIGLQGKHGGAPIWFRNLRIKQLLD